MADPVSMAITLGLTAAGGIIGAMGASEKAGASNMYQYKAAVAQANQRIATQNAQYETELGGVQAQRAGLAGRQALGQMTAAQAASGIDINTGTARDVRTSQIEGIQTEEGTIRSDAARRAYGYEVEGMNYTSEGQLDTLSARNARVAGGYDVASSLLGGATGVADKWSKFSQAGVGGDTFNKPFSFLGT